MQSALHLSELIHFAVAAALSWVCIRHWRRNAHEERVHRLNTRRAADTAALIGHPRVYGYGVALVDTPDAREFVRKALILAGNNPEDAARLADEIPFHGRLNA